MKNGCRLIIIVSLLIYSSVILSQSSLLKPNEALKVDTSWPKALQNNWILGQVSGIAVDSLDHIWIIQRPTSLTADERGASFSPPLSKCCIPAPPVMEFDQQGNLIQAWGGPNKEYDWPTTEHGIFIDDKNAVWITGSGEEDGQILKFTRQGKFIMQIGRPGPQTNSNDISRLGRPASIAVDTTKHEVYVADGYYNHRVIVFDSETGAYKRHWGAYGKPPKDLGKRTLSRLEPPSSIPAQQFGNPVHCVRLSHEGLVYVCDRINDRIQIFKKDGTFLREFIVEPKTAANGSVWDLAFSKDPKQNFLYIADGRNNQLLILERKSGKIIGKYMSPGRNAGQFHWVHDIAIDSKGNIYTGEVETGKRIQKFVSK